MRERTKVIWDVLPGPSEKPMTYSEIAKLTGLSVHSVIPEIEWRIPRGDLEIFPPTKELKAKKIRKRVISET